jgi:ATP-dependent DNA ligase
MSWPFRQTLSFDPAAERALIDLTHALTKLTDLGVKLMTSLDNLTVAANAIVAEIGAAITEIQSLASLVTSLTAQLAAAVAAQDSAAIDAVTSQLGIATANLTTAVAAAAAALPAAAPAPVSAPAA